MQLPKIDSLRSRLTKEYTEIAKFATASEQIFNLIVLDAPGITNDNPLVNIRRLLDNIKENGMSNFVDQPRLSGNCGLFYVKIAEPSNPTHRLSLRSQKNCFYTISDQRDGVPATLAHYAVCRNRADILALLIHYNFYVDTPVVDNYGKTVTALDIACENNFEECAHILRTPDRQERYSHTMCILT